jgi:hypothetical protein
MGNKIEIGKLYINILDQKRPPDIYCVTGFRQEEQGKFVEFVWMNNRADAEQKHGDPKYVEETAIELGEWIKLIEEELDGQERKNQDRQDIQKKPQSTKYISRICPDNRRLLSRR